MTEIFWTNEFFLFSNLQGTNNYECTRTPNLQPLLFALAFKILLILQPWCQKLDEEKRICKIALQTFGQHYGWTERDERTKDLSDFDLDTFVEHYPEMRRILPDILKHSTPFSF